MFRFKLRTLLIATALIGLFLGIHVHVHNKAKRFVKEMRKHHGDKLREASISPPSFEDVIFLRRRCVVTSIHEVQLEGMYSNAFRSKSISTVLPHSRTYRVYLYGEAVRQRLSSESAQRNTQKLIELLKSEANRKIKKD